MKHGFALMVILAVLLAQGSVLRGEPVKVEAYQATIKVACVGDSITFGSGVKDREKNNYPTQLAGLLGEKWEVRNFGVSGATLLKQGDKPYWKEKAFKQAMEYKPDVLIVKLGTNDTKPQNWKHGEEYAADYKALVEEFRKVNPDVKIYACLPVPAFPGNFGIRDSVIKEEVVPAIKKVAEETKINVIDLYAALADKPKLVPDKVHPNAEGATIMAQTVYGALTGKTAK
jgi:acyl-CoA thioesterase-1